MSIASDRLEIIRKQVEAHLDQGRAVEHLPVFAMAAAPIDELRQRGARLVEQLAVVKGLQATVEDSEAYLGGGSLPAEALPSCAVVLRGTTIGEDELLDRLRRGRVVGRVSNGAVWLDLRTVPAGQDEQLLAAIRSAME